MTVGERIYQKRIELGLSQEELAQKVGYKDRSSIARIESGERDIRQHMVVAFAAALQTSPAWLMGFDEKHEAPKPNAQIMPQDKIRMIPVFESASAGFGIGAENRVVEFIPLFIQSDTEASRTICVRVCGDSMHPQIQDGDLVQVLKQDTAETGDIVVILDGDNGYVKRFILGKNGVVLESFNTAYPPMKFTREESNDLRIVGVVKRVIRDL